MSVTPARPGPEAYEEKNLLSEIGILEWRLVAFGRRYRRRREACRDELRAARAKLERLCCAGSPPPATKPPGGHASRPRD